MKLNFSHLFQTSAPTSTVLIRMMVGGVFLSEGIQKFLFPQALGVGRFLKIGIPAPETLGPFVGGVEVVGGALLLIGLLTRPAALALLINISVAIFSTKLPILLGHGFLGFKLASNLSSYGFWPMAHEMRTDFCMWMGSLFLVIVAAGGWSVDRILFRNVTRLSGNPTKRLQPTSNL